MDDQAITRVAMFVNKRCFPWQPRWDCGIFARKSLACNLKLEGAYPRVPRGMDRMRKLCLGAAYSSHRNLALLQPIACADNMALNGAVQSYLPPFGAPCCCATPEPWFHPSGKLVWHASKPLSHANLFRSIIICPMLQVDSTALKLSKEIGRCPERAADRYRLLQRMHKQAW